LAAVSPVLIVVGDVHWINPTLRELLDLIIDRLPELAVLCLITFGRNFRRPGLSAPTCRW
jgi:predicted ATPase